MTNRLRLSVPLFAVFLLSACIDVPDVAGPEDLPDAGQPPSDAGSLPDGGEQPAGDFELSVMPTEDSILQGATRSFQVSLVRKNGFNGSVSVMLVSPPGGITAPSVTIPGASTLSSLSISVSEQVAPGPVTLTVRGISGALHRDRSVSLTIVPLGDLALSWVAPSASYSATNGGLSVEVAVQGGQAEKVELMKGDTVLTTWTAPPYTYSWDTTSEAEGEYTLVAKATRTGSTFASVARTVVVDRTAPSIASRQPAHGATQVSARTRVEVGFSEAVKAATVSTSNVGLIGDGGVPIPVALELSADGRTLTLTPAASLAASTAVSVRLGTAEQPITDEAGNILTTGGSWSFAVPFWLPMGGAISASPGNTPAENVVMKVGTDGLPVIAWSESDGTSKNIYVSKWDGNTWQALGAALSANSEASTHADRPALAIDGANIPIVIWEEFSPDGRTINFHGRRWLNASWQPLPAFPSLSAEQREARTKASAAIDGNGTLYVYGDFYTGISNNLTSMHFPPNGSAWIESNTSFPTEELQRWSTSLSTYGANTLFAAYTSILSTGTFEYRGITVIKNHRTPIGGPVLSDTSSHGTNDPFIAIDGAGNPYVAWSETPRGTTSGNIHVAHHDGNSWKFLAPQSNDAQSSNETPALGIDPQGRPVVAWSGFVQPERAIFVKRWENEQWSSLGPALSARAGSTTSSFKPALAFDAEGTPLVAWHEFTGATSDIFAYQLNQ
jgi:hypothetical protein